MKRIILLLTAVLIYNRTVHSQSKNFICNALIENKKIDSMMSIVKNHYKNKKLFFSIDVIENGTAVIFSINKLEKKNRIFQYQLQSKDIKEIGFFDFGTYTVFVNSNYDPHVFFKKTKFLKEFKLFIYSDENYFKGDPGQLPIGRGDFVFTIQSGDLPVPIR